MGHEVRRLNAAKFDSDPEPRRLPAHRDDCRDGLRPCPYVSCRHNLFLDLTKAGGLRFTRSDLEPDELPETCVLDLVEREGGLTLEAIGGLLGLSRERVRQIEVIAKRRFNAVAERLGLAGHL